VLRAGILAVADVSCALVEEVVEFALEEKEKLVEKEDRLSLVVVG
jgi:hypothetical protein